MKKKILNWLFYILGVVACYEYARYRTLQERDWTNQDRAICGLVSFSSWVGLAMELVVEFYLYEADKHPALDHANW